MSDNKNKTIAMDGFTARADGYSGKSSTPNKESRVAKARAITEGYQAITAKVKPVPTGGSSGQKK